MLLGLAGLSLSGCASAAAARGGYLRLFNGRDLEGWRATPGGLWAVENGVLVGRSPASETRHGLLVSDGPYDDFDLRLRYRSLKGNSGVYFRVDLVPEFWGAEGFQAEVEPEFGHVGGLYETNGRAWVSQPARQRVATWHRPYHWNAMRIRAVGGDVTVWINGKVASALRNDPGRRRGAIALQLHGDEDMHVEYKDIYLRRL